jgi:hypothetical protein
LRIAAGTVVWPRAVMVAGISRISAVFAIAGSLDYDTISCNAFAL